MKKILCLAAHPDDEVLGCGATLAKHSKNGDQVQVVIAAEGLTSRDSSTQAAELEKLKNKAVSANTLLGVEKVHFLTLPDNRMDSVDLLDVVKSVEEIVYQFKPDVIYTHFHGDLNVDHQILNRAVLTCCRPQPQFSVKEIYAFEVLSATHWNPGDVDNQFVPNYFVNTEDFMAKKIEALKIYESEMRAFPHARSIEAIQSLAQWRGSLVGYKAAEAFEILRLLKD